MIGKIFLSIGLGFLLLCSNMVGSSAFAWPCDICWNQTTKNDCNSISECQGDLAPVMLVQIRLALL